MPQQNDFTIQKAIANKLRDIYGPSLQIVEDLDDRHIYDRLVIYYRANQDDKIVPLLKSVDITYHDSDINDRYRYYIATVVFKEDYLRLRVVKGTFLLPTMTMSDFEIEYENHNLIDKMAKILNNTINKTRQQITDHLKASKTPQINKPTYINIVKPTQNRST